jgi:hypothetical protein
MEDSKRVLPVPPIPPQSFSRSRRLGSSDSNTSAPDEGLSFIIQFSKIIFTNFKNIPRLLKNHIIWLLPLVLIWMLLSFDITSLTSNINVKLKLFRIVDKLSPLIFLTAAYNNFLGKALFAGFIGGLVVPLIKESKKVGSFGTVFKTLLAKYIKVIKLAIGAFKEKGVNAYIMLLGFGGLGLAFSNLLTRNNKADKYLVCLTTAIMIVNSMSRGINDPVTRLIRAFWRDVMRVFKKGFKLSVSTLYIAMFSFALTLALSIIVFSFVRFTNDFVDNTGYYIGFSCVVISIILYFIAGKKNELSK